MYKEERAKNGWISIDLFCAPYNFERILIIQILWNAGKKTMLNPKINWAVLPLRQSLPQLPRPNGLGFAILCIFVLTKLVNIQHMFFPSYFLNQLLFSCLFLSGFETSLTLQILKYTTEIYIHINNF